MKYLNELTTVIKDIAKNETDEIIINYYEEIIYSMENGIVALINFVSMQYTHIHTAYIVLILHYRLQHWRIMLQQIM